MAGQQVFEGGVVEVGIIEGLEGQIFFRHRAAVFLSVIVQSAVGIVVQVGVGGNGGRFGRRLGGHKGNGAGLLIAGLGGGGHLGGAQAVGVHIPGVVQTQHEHLHLVIGRFGGILFVDEHGQGDGAGGIGLAAGNVFHGVADGGAVGKEDEQFGLGIFKVVYPGGQAQFQHGIQLAFGPVIHEGVKAHAGHGFVCRLGIALCGGGVFGFRIDRGLLLDGHGIQGAAAAKEGLGVQIGRCGYLTAVTGRQGEEQGNGHHHRHGAIDQSQGVAGVGREGTGDEQHGDDGQSGHDEHTVQNGFAGDERG